MDVHPTKNGIYRYWPIPMCGLCLDSSWRVSRTEMKKQNQGRKGGKSLLHVTMYEQTTKLLDHEISGCFWDYFGVFKSVNLGIQGTMIFHKYNVHFLNWKSKCLNYIQQGSHQTRWSHGCLNSPISFLPSVFFLWRSSNMLSTKPKRQLDMESIDDGLNRRFHPGMCGGSVVASAQMAIP